MEYLFIFLFRICIFLLFIEFIKVSKDLVEVVCSCCEYLSSNWGVVGEEIFFLRG